jgi:hypothetical protein
MEGSASLEIFSAIGEQMKKVLSSLLLFTILAAACMNKSNKVSYPESTDGLKKLMSDILDAQKSGDTAKFKSLVKDLELPDAEGWFKNVFGDDKGAKAAAQYKSQTSSLQQDLEKLFAKIVSDGQTEIKITRLEKADDPQATGNQKDVIAAMKNPVPIYSARFVKPGETLGMHLYNYVYVDGTFRLAGKMDAAKG